jgi:hypothetical protein
MSSQVCIIFAPLVPCAQIGSLAEQQCNLHLCQYYTLYTISLMVLPLSHLTAHDCH